MEEGRHKKLILYDSLSKVQKQANQICGVRLYYSGCLE